jgi:plasmid stabilization system protein ParE
MRVIVARQVKEFLETEKRYLRKHSNSAHTRLASRLRETLRMLADFPLAGVERPLPVPGLRPIVVDDYVLDYEVAGRELHILAMRHVSATPTSRSTTTLTSRPDRNTDDWQLIGP